MKITTAQLRQIIKEELDNKMNDFIINEKNIKDICVEIIAALVNMRVLPHDVPVETFDKWTSIIEKQIRYEAHNSSFKNNKGRQ